MASQLTSHIQDNNLLDTLQSGFRHGHSTETAILQIVDDALRTLDSGNSCLLVLLDLSSAFDTVNHRTLIQTLELRMGCGGTVLNWFTSYLSNRSQVVKIGNSVSKTGKRQQVVSQGSILAPTVFNLCLEPLCEILRNAGILVYLYADDTQI